jgi:hypothetical protein
MGIESELEGISTPEVVETPIGELTFFDGVPSEPTVGLVYDYIDRARGVEVFLNAMHNWLQTIPGKSWFVALRMYGPEQPWIDKIWRPGEIERVT